MLVSVLAITSVFLLGCTNRPPPTDEFANEVIDSLTVPDSVKECMHGVVDSFTLTDGEKQKFGDLTGAADAAAKLDPKAEKQDETAVAGQAVIDRFQQELAACN